MDQSPALYALKAAKQTTPKPPAANAARDTDSMSHKDWQSAVKYLTNRLDQLEKTYGQNKPREKPDTSYEAVNWGK